MTDVSRSRTVLEAALNSFAVKGKGLSWARIDNHDALMAAVAGMDVGTWPQDNRIALAQGIEEVIREAIVSLGVQSTAYHVARTLFSDDEFFADGTLTQRKVLYNQPVVRYSEDQYKNGRRAVVRVIEAALIARFQPHRLGATSYARQRVMDAGDLSLERTRAAFDDEPFAKEAEREFLPDEVLSRLTLLTRELELLAVRLVGLDWATERFVAMHQYKDPSVPLRLDPSLTTADAACSFARADYVLREISRLPAGHRFLTRHGLEPWSDGLSLQYAVEMKRASTFDNSELIIEGFLRHTRVILSEHPTVEPHVLIALLQNMAPDALPAWQKLMGTRSYSFRRMHLIHALTELIRTFRPYLPDWMRDLEHDFWDIWYSSFDLVGADRPREPEPEDVRASERAECLPLAAMVRYRYQAWVLGYVWPVARDRLGPKVVEGDAEWGWIFDSVPQGEALTLLRSRWQGRLPELQAALEAAWPPVQGQ